MTERLSPHSDYKLNTQGDNNHSLDVLLSQSVVPYVLTVAS